MTYDYHFNLCTTITYPRTPTRASYLISVGWSRRTGFKHSFGQSDLTGKDFWGAGSACLRDLEVMHMKGIWVEDLIHALKITEGYITYPSLRVLELEDSCFLIGCEGDSEETLRDVMEMQVERGVGIHTLRLVECRELPDDQVQGFREVIATVD